MLQSSCKRWPNDSIDGASHTSTVQHRAYCNRSRYPCPQIPHAVTEALTNHHPTPRFDLSILRRGLAGSLLARHCTLSMRMLPLYLPGIKLAKESKAGRGDRGRRDQKLRAHGTAMQRCRPISGVRRVICSEYCLAIRFVWPYIARPPPASAAQWLYPNSLSYSHRIAFSPCSCASNLFSQITYYLRVILQGSRLKRTDRQSRQYVRIWICPRRTHPDFVSRWWRQSHHFQQTKEAECSFF